MKKIRKIIGVLMIVIILGLSGKLLAFDYYKSSMEKDPNADASVLPPSGNGYIKVRRNSSESASERKEIDDSSCWNTTYLVPVRTWIEWYNFTLNKPDCIIIKDAWTFPITIWITLY